MVAARFVFKASALQNDADQYQFQSQACHTEKTACYHPDQRDRIVDTLIDTPTEDASALISQSCNSIWLAPGVAGAASGLTAAALADAARKTPAGDRNTADQLAGAS